MWTTTTTVVDRMILISDPRSPRLSWARASEVAEVHDYGNGQVQLILRSGNQYVIKGQAVEVMAEMGFGPQKDDEDQR